MDQITYGKTPSFDTNFTYWIKVKGIDGPIFYDTISDRFFRYSWAKGKVKANLYNNLKFYILKRIL